MGKFAAKCFFISLVLFFGVLLGMQSANNGLQKMKGYQDPALKGAFELKENRNKKLEASILGNTINSQDLEGKQKKLEQIKTFNPLSETGRKLTSVIETSLNKAVDSISSIISKMIGGRHK
ncbi:YqxA family protein [Metabacillus sp. RGM 3146]|uniref:YqxA family protein n=1 Tax=Metabacillus sp. RGM 3146 TaxID=3401092 RepID=UPI003B9C21C7